MNPVTEIKSPIKKELLEARQKPQKTEKQKITNTAGETPHQTLEKFARLPDRNTKIADIKAIPESRHQIPQDEAHMEALFELPVREACMKLFDTGVETTTSSANGENDLSQGSAHIFVNYDSLSEKNKEVARSLAKTITEEGKEPDPNQSDNETALNLNRNQDGKRILQMRVPLTDASTVGEVEGRFRIYTDQFENQRIDWIKPDTFQGVCDANGVSPTDTKPEDFVREFGYYLDTNSGLFYQSKFIFDAVKKHENDPI